MQHGGARSLLVAQRLELLGGFSLLAQSLTLGLGLLRDRAERSLERGLLLLDMGASRDPMEVMLERLCCADLAGDLAIALRPACLTPKLLQLRGELTNKVRQAREICLRRLQSELGLMAAAVQTGNASGIFEHTAALLRRGIDDLADAALAHQRRRARAGRGILEQEAHFAGASVLPIHPIGRTRLALDAARHFELVAIVELGRRSAGAVVDEQRDLGGVARRTILRACEDHILHGRTAHAFVGHVAHGPAQRLKQVRLAAAVGSDHAGQAGFDQELGWLDKGFEAEKAEASDFHVSEALEALDISFTRQMVNAAFRLVTSEGGNPLVQDDEDCGGGACSIMDLISSKVTSPCALRPLMKKVGVPITPNCRPRCFTSVKPAIMV